MRKKCIPDTLPEILPPSGFDEGRRKYPFKQIREFCTDETKDIVCPRPEVEGIQVNNIPTNNCFDVQCQVERPRTVRECGRENNRENGRAKSTKKRPAPNVEESSSDSDSSSQPCTSIPRGRGRGGKGNQPRGRGKIRGNGQTKSNKKAASIAEKSSSDTDSSNQPSTSTRRGRGRGGRCNQTRQPGRLSKMPSGLNSLDNYFFVQISFVFFL